MDLKEEALLGPRPERHWYYRSKLLALRRLTRDRRAAKVLDVGAGSGIFTRALLSLTDAVSGVCIDPGYASDRDEKVAGKPLSFRRAVATSDADLVLMMDVLEHVRDDAALVREYAEKVGSGTRFVVSVPAFSWLWSGHDVFLGHERRYVLRSLRRTLGDGGLIVERACYFYGAVLPLVAATRLVQRNAAPRSQMRPLPPLLDAMLAGVCMFEARLFTVNRIGGVTAFAVARRP